MIKNVLLIGHKSFVGSEFRKSIINKDNLNLFFLDRYFLEEDILSLSKKDFIKKYFSLFENIDAIVSCLHVHKKKFDQELEVNIKVYENILHFAKIKKIKKIIYLSSVNVSKNKSSSYAYIKYQIEDLFSSCDNSIIIRPSFIISIDNDKNLLGGRDGVSFKIFEKFFNYNLPIPIIGDGKYLFTYCFLKDLSNLMLFLLEDDTFLNKKINFFSGEFLNFTRFIDSIAKIKNKKKYKVYLPFLFVRVLCKLKILDHKNIDNLLNQRIYYNYYYLLKKKISIKQLLTMDKKR